MKFAKNSWIHFHFRPGCDGNFWQLQLMQCEILASNKGSPQPKPCSTYRMNEYLIIIIHTCLAGLCAQPRVREAHTDTRPSSHSTFPWLTKVCGQKCNRLCAFGTSTSNTTTAPAHITALFWNHFGISFVSRCTLLSLCVHPLLPTYALKASSCPPAATQASRYSILLHRRLHHTHSRWHWLLTTYSVSTSSQRSAAQRRRDMQPYTIHRTGRTTQQQQQHHPREVHQLNWSTKREHF